MSDCAKVEILFEGYFHGDLTPAEDLHLQRHLSGCSRCREKLDRAYHIHIRLKQYRRAAVPKTLLPEFYRHLKQLTGKDSFLQRFKYIPAFRIDPRSSFLSFARVVTILALGIMIGWFLFTSPEPEMIVPDGMPYPVAREITSNDIDYVYYYLMTSEILLLEYYNQTETMDFYLDRELAQKLLIKTFRVHEIGLRLNDLRIIRFVGRMEILLHEASNLKENEVEDFLDTVRMVISETDMLREVSSLQVRFRQKKDQFGS